MNKKVSWFKTGFIFLSLGLLILGPISRVRVCFSLPEPSEVVSGTATFTYPDNNTLQINATDKAIVNYNSFDIKNNESVIVNLPSSDSEFLNRVTGDKASKILGSLTSNGILILVNPNGITFGPNASVDVAGLIASTRDITNSDFLASKFVFNKLSKDQLDTLLINKGNITIRQGGFGVFIAGAIENEGVITANLGTIAMAAGDMVTLNLSGNELISVAIDKATASKVYDLDGKPVTEQIKNTGTISAAGGTVLIKAEALPGIFEKAINLEGYVKADKLENKDGVIRIVSSGKVEISGEVTASGLVSVEAGEIEAKVIAPNTEFFKTTGNIEIIRSTASLDGLITLEGEGFEVTYLKSTNLTLESNNAINTSPGVIISASQLKVIAKQFGSIEVPLVLDARLTYIKRITGDIEIMQSLGIGSTIMLRGPPSGFGAITYNADTQLTLEVENVVFNGNFTLFNDLVIEGNLKVVSGEIRGNGTKGSPVITVKKDLIFTGNGYTYFGYRDLLGEGDYRFTVNLEGNLTLDNPNAWVYSDINFTGSKDQTISYTQGTIYGSLKVNKPSGKLNYGELNLTQLPLYFVTNQGQIPSAEVKFYIYLGNSLVYFTPQYVLYSFTQIDSNGSLQRQNIWLNFNNANPDTSIEPEFTTGAIFNYFKGSDPSLWQTNISTYYKIIYNELYPGINLIYSSKEGHLETEFLILAGANYQNIQLSYTGITGLSIDAQGNLIIKTSLGDLLEARPYAYQNIAGLTQKITAEYTLLSNTSYGYKVTGYNPQYPLIIDPTLAYSTFLGGSGDDNVYGLAVDSSGNVYIAGQTTDAVTDFPTTAGTYNTTHNGGTWDAFVAKLNATGTSLTYSTFLGGTGADYAYRVAIDSLGNAYVTGRTASANFPTTAGAYDTTHNGADDVFVAKLNSTGTSLTWSTFLGGSGNDFGHGIAVDSSGNVYITVETVDAATDFPTTAGAYDTTHNGLTDAAIAKLNSTGTSLIWSTFLGGSGNDVAYGLAIDSSGNVYVGGYTGSSNFPTTAGAYDTTHNGGDDAFVAKLSSDGSSLTWSTFLGGSGNDYVYGGALTIDSASNVYVSGYTGSTNFPTTSGAYDTTHNGGDDVFVAKISSNGSSLTYSTFLGGSGNDYGFRIAVDSAGNAYVVGYTGSSNFPTTAGAYDTTHNGLLDAFLVKLNSNGTSLTYSTFIGGSGNDYGNAIALDSSGNVYVGGDASSGFPTTAGAYDTTQNGGLDGFVAKFAFSYTWNGSSSTNWATAANWDVNAVPESIDSVVIANVTNAPLLDSARTVNNVTINSGGVLDLNSNNLTLTGTFTNNGTLKLIGSETLTGFTNNTNSGTIQYAGTATYTGLIAGNTYNNLTFSSSGTYNLNANLTVNGNLTITTGTLSLSTYNLTLGASSVFSNTSGTLKLVGSQTLTNFTNDTDSGTTQYAGTGTYTSLVAGNTYNSLVFAGSGSYTLNANLTVNGGLTILAGTLDLSTYNLTLAPSSVFSNDSTLKLVGSQTLTNFTNDTDTGTTQYAGTGTYTSLIAGNTYNALVFAGSGSYTLNAALNVNNNLTILAGTLAAGSQSVNIGGSFSNSGTFTTSGTVTFNATALSKTITSGSASFNNLTFNGVGGGWTLQDALDVNGNLTITNGTVNANAKTMTIGGSWSNSGTFTAGGNTVTFDATTTGKTITQGGSSFYNLIFNGVGGGWTYGDSVINVNVTVSNGTLTTLNFETSGAYNQSGGTVTAALGNTVIFNTFTQSGGNFTAPPGTLTVKSTFNRTGGTFTHNSGTVRFLVRGSDYTITTGGATFNNVTFDMDEWGADVAVTLADSFTVAGNLTVQNTNWTNYLYTIKGSGSPTITVSGNLSFPSTAVAAPAYFGNTSSNFAVNLAGNFSISDTQAYMRANLAFNGTGAQNITQSAGTIDAGTWTINKTAGVATQLSNLSLGNSLTISQGTLSINSYNLTVTNAFTVGASGTLRLQGSETIPTPTLNSGSTVDYNGTGTYTGLKAGNNYYNLTFSGSGTYTLNAILWVNSNLTLSAGTLDVSSSNYAVNVYGNWNNTGGAFTARQGDVLLQGSASQTITSRGYSFYKLIIKNSIRLTDFSGSFNYAAPSLTTGVTFSDALNANSLILSFDSGAYSDYYVPAGMKRITFASGLTHTITNLFDVRGTTSYLVQLASTVDGSTWSLDAPNNSTISYVFVKDSTLAGGKTITANNSYNGGNNSGWTFTNITFSGTANWSNTANWGHGYLPGQYDNLTVNGTLTLSGNYSANSITVNSGKSIDLGGYNLTASGGIANNGNLTLRGDEAITGTVTNAAGSTVTYTGTGSFSSLKAGTSYSNLVFNSSGGSWALDNNTTINGNLTVSAGTLNLGSKTISIAGNFTVNGGISSGTSKVIFTNASQITYVYGTTFNDLEITEAGKEVQFNAGSTETILGTLTIRGAAGNPVILRSTSAGSQWKIDPQGTIDVNYVNVRDSNNINSRTIGPSSYTDSGNNNNWFTVATTTITSTNLEQATKSTDTISTAIPTTTSIVNIQLASITTVSEAVSTASASSQAETTAQAETTTEEEKTTAKQEESAPTAGFDEKVSYEESGKRYAKPYVPGKYRTVVILFEGKVITAPYDEKGIKENQAVVLLPGDKISREGLVRAEKAPSARYRVTVIVFEGDPLKIMSYDKGQIKEGKEVFLNPGEKLFQEIEVK